ncbi:hypothetical protein [Paenibacillus pabuli]|uniref:hypothetical protein n=1 Tax=Paenibacillus pabuli TaxID=1472 RepID=UPI00157D94C9|nr:hypothetical protein [Paenibacillus pabuli]MEC0128437.1 hypothetical protein [Paenibacillus pabuli]
MGTDRRRFLMMKEPFVKTLLVFGAEGWRIHNNTLVERLTQVQIEAPLFQMLRSIDPATDGYSNTLGRGFISPSLYVENVSVIY